MDKPNFIVDLHAHTNRSDGLDTPLQFVDRAVEIGMKVMAMTDHDVVPPKSVILENEEKDIVLYAREKGLDLVLGTEFSCDTNIEDVHLVAYECDWEHPKMSEIANRIAESKVESYKKLVSLLSEEGLKISWDELLLNNGNPIKEEEIQKKMIFNMLADKGHFASWKDAKLMTQSNKALNVPREKPDPREIIRTVHELGGMVVVAHPFLIDPDPDKVFAYLEPLMAAGLDGIEATYTYSKTNYKGDKTDAELRQLIIEKYGSRDLFISGGSDYHGEWRKGTQNTREMGESGISLEEYKKSKLYQMRSNKS